MFGIKFTRNKPFRFNEALFILGFLMSIAAGVSLWTQRTLTFWCSYFKGDEVDVPYWLSFITTLLLNAIIVAINIISEIIRLVVG